MPKKFRNRANDGPKVHMRGDGPRNSRHFFGHDDRTVQVVPMETTKLKNSRPRVSFKNQDRSSQRIAKLAMAMKKTFDDDFPMASGGNNNGSEVIIQHGRGQGAPRGRRSPLSWNKNDRTGIRIRNRQKMGNPEALWIHTKSHSFRITISFGHKYERTFILNNLLSYIAPDTFVPIMYRVTDNAAIFYVDNQKIASKLSSCDRRITTSDGYKLAVRCDASFPQYNIDQKMREKMKQAMAKRYVAETNALDLSRFHLDPELVEDYFCALCRPSILLAVLDIVTSVIPNLEALNLDNNHLNSFERLSPVMKNLSSLKILYLGENRIRDLNQLNPFKDLQLDELRLAGNPVCDKFKGRNDEYVSEVRGKFPKLMKLDGVELPRPIGFDVENEATKLPPTQRMFISNPKAQEIASQFLQQYFLIFDNDNRQPLLDAYHEQAYFSLTVSPSLTPDKTCNYYSENRNLKKIDDVAKRRKLLKFGRLSVVSFISEMPKTRHDLNSFTMDLGLVTDGMMVITVAGVFKEIETKEERIRYFNRTFIIVPEGSGYCIRNEQVHITHPTSLQRKHAFAPRKIAENNEPAPEVATPSTSTSSGQPTDEVKQQMTVTLSQHTNMNLEWSFKCLKEVNWNFDVALAAFQEFFKLGRIPPEAFKK